MPPVWKAVAVTAKESWLPTILGSVDAVSGMNPFMGLRISPQPLGCARYQDGVPGVPRYVGNMSCLRRSCPETKGFYLGQGLSTFAGGLWGAGSSSGVGLGHLSGVGGCGGHHGVFSSICRLYSWSASSVLHCTPGVVQ